MEEIFCALTINSKMSAAKKYFIQEHLHREVFHGGIFNIDAEKIFLSAGYKAIEFPGTFDFSLMAKWERVAYLIKMFFTVAAGDLVIFQFPLYAKIHILLLQLLRLKGAKVICLIIDIEGLREGNASVLEKEKKALRRFPAFIVHNERMYHWIQSLVPKVPIAQLQFFDFLTTPVSHFQKKDTRIVFAGNLHKSRFIQDLEKLSGPCPEITFSVYGPGCPAQNTFPANADYKGVFAPYELVDHLQGSFGLVWDGTSIESCTGSYGDYLAYNSPHKLSLYIMAGIPLIAPKMSASALLIEQYGIGCTIDRLSDIGDVIRNISDSAYQKMVDNTRLLAVQLSQGHFLKRALTELEQTVCEN